MSQSRKFIQKILEEEDGAAMVEYALIVGLIGLAVAGGAGYLGEGVATIFSDLAKNLRKLAKGNGKVKW